MATTLDVHRTTRHRAALALVLLVVGCVLSWAAASPAVVARNADQPATPANEALHEHAWGPAGCFLPGAAIDEVPGLFDFRHACTHHGGCYQGLDREGEPAVIDRLRCDELFRTDLVASCAVVHGSATGWRARECVNTAEAYVAIARGFGAAYYTGRGDSA